MKRIRSLFQTLLLAELARGLWVTMKNFFRPKVTLDYPEEKTPQCSRLRGLQALRQPIGRQRLELLEQDDVRRLERHVRRIGDARQLLPGGLALEDLAAAEAVFDAVIGRA